MSRSGPEARPSEGTGEIAELRERLRLLEARVERLEREAAPEAEGPEAEAEGPALDTEVTTAQVFTRVAMLCFVLLGALILRVLTQQNVLGALFGTVLGFAYAGHLIVLSFIPGRFGRLARETSLFQCSGAVLAFIIAAESAMRVHTIGRPAAMIIVGGFAALSVASGLLSRKATLAGTGIVGGILGLVALDLEAGGLALQLGLLVALAALGLGVSWREGWRSLRPVIIPLVLVLFPGGLFLYREQAEIARGLLAASAAVFGVVAVQHLAVFRRLGPAAVWLPLATLWFVGFRHAAGGSTAGAEAAGISAAALVLVAVLARRTPGAVPGLAGLAATVALAGTAGWPLVDRTGLLCAVSGLALWWAARRAVPPWAAVFATLLMLAAALASLAQVVRPPLSSVGLASMPLTAAILLLHYYANGRVGKEPYRDLAMRLAPVALAAGLCVLLGFCRELLPRVLVEPPHVLLGQTVVLVFTAVALTSWSHFGHRRSAFFCGVACMGLALIKALAVDLVRLKSLHMLASVVLVGLASVAISLILRKRA